MDKEICHYEVKFEAGEENSMVYESLYFKVRFSANVWCYTCLTPHNYFCPSSYPSQTRSLHHHGSEHRNNRDEHNRVAGTGRKQKRVPTCVWWGRCARHVQLVGRRSFPSVRGHHW